MMLLAVLSVCQSVKLIRQFLGLSIPLPPPNKQQQNRYRIRTTDIPIQKERGRRGTKSHWFIAVLKYSQANVGSSLIIMALLNYMSPSSKLLDLEVVLGTPAHNRITHYHRFIFNYYYLFVA